MTAEELLRDYINNSPDRAYDNSNGICIADENEYIPLFYRYSTSDDIIKTLKNGLTYLQYPYIEYTSTSINVGNYASFFGAFNPTTNTRNSWRQIRRSNLPKGYLANIFTLIHIPYDENTYTYEYENQKLLVVMAVKKEYLSRKFVEDRINEVPDYDLNHYCLLVSNELVRDTKHSIIYRNAKQNIIDPISQHIDVIYTNNVNNLCNNKFRHSRKIANPIPGFIQVDDMFNHYKSINDDMVEAIGGTVVRETEPISPIDENSTGEWEAGNTVEDTEMVEMSYLSGLQAIPPENWDNVALPRPAPRFIASHDPYILEALQYPSGHSGAIIVGTSGVEVHPDMTNLFFSPSEATTILQPTSQSAEIINPNISFRNMEDVDRIMNEIRRDENIANNTEDADYIPF